MRHGTLIVGGSLAGLRAAETLRTDGLRGPLTLIGAEDRLPYDRPPLSKKVLVGEWEPERIALRKRRRRRLARRSTSGSACEAVRLDLDARAVDARPTASACPSTVWSSPPGASVRRLPGQPELDGIHVLRTLDDSPRAAGRARPPGRRASWSSAPASSVPRWRRRPAGSAATVTIVEALPVPLVAGPRARRWARPARSSTGDHGVELRLGVGVAAFEGSGRVERVRLTDGTARAGRRGGRRHRRRAGDRLAGGLGSRAARRRRVRRRAGRRARPASTPPATCAAGPTSSSARRCGSSTGPTPPSRAPPRPRNLLAETAGQRAGSPTRPCRSSGATSTSRASSSSAGPIPTTRSGSSAARWSERRLRRPYGRRRPPARGPGPLAAEAGDGLPEAPGRRRELGRCAGARRGRG